MKKLFALMLSIAMVASMFSGIAFAATPNKVVLNTTSFVTSGAQYGTFTVSGSLTDSDGVILSGAKNIVMYHTTYAPANVVYAGVTSTNGTFAFLVPTTLDVKEYKVAVLTTDATPVVDVNYTEATFTVKYAVSLSTALEYNFGSGQVVVQGTVKDSTGKAVSGKSVTLELANTPILGASATTTAAGEFGFIVNGWSAPGTLWLKVDGVPHVKGEVKPSAMTLSASPNTGIIAAVAPTTITLTTGGIPTGETPQFALYKGVEADNVSVSITQPTSVATNKYELVHTFAEKGTYTLVMTAAGGNYKASATLTVVDPVRYSLIGAENLKDMNVGSKILTFASSGTNPVYVIEHPAPSPAEPIRYTVTVDGTVVLSAAQADYASKTAVTLTATKLGTKTIRIQGFKEHPTALTWTVAVFDATYTMEVKGWDVTYEVKTMTVNETKDITFVVKDKDGNPVNNAKIWIDGAVKVSAATTNIQNGVYVAKDVKFTSVGQKAVLVTTLADVDMATFSPAGINVVGVAAYTVTADATTLLQGKSQTIRLVVTEGGTTLIPHLVKVQHGKDGATIETVGATPKDTNNDGIADAIDITFKALTTYDVVIRPQNSDGTKMGEVKLNVVAPTLVVEGNEFLTQDFDTELKFKVVDPRTNTVLSDALTVVPKHTTVVLTDDLERPHAMLGASAYHVFGLATVSTAQATAAKDAKEISELTFTIFTDNIKVAGTFPVKKATLTSTPETVLIGVPNNMTITYTDANGSPIEGKEVRLGSSTGTLIAKTNAAGQVFYALAQGATTAVEFFAQTDVTANWNKLTVAAGFDSAAPVITAPATVDAATAVITIKDNVRVARLMVNGVEINIFPTPTVNHVVNLTVGVNTFNVIAMDANYNVVEQTVTITRTAPAAPIVITLGQANPAIGLDVAPALVSGRTMVPFRWFGERVLGIATENITWNEATGSGTMIHGGHTVILTVNSMTASVNGQAVALDAAPFITGGRILVPARFLAETFGFTITWDAATNNVTIVKN